MVNWRVVAKTAGVCMVLAVLSGCNTLQLYQGEPLPADQVAKVQLGEIGVHIRKVNGIDVGSSIMGVELLPGRHQLDLVYESPSDVYMTTTSTLKTVDLRAGKTYLVMTKEVSERLIFVVEER
jgi:hypothetical protein